ncbi:MAG: ATP-binding protein [Nitrospinales bacterium]
MKPSPNPLKEILQNPENEHLEVKEAKNSFEFEKLVKYCAALANEGGGKMVLGVTDNVPRDVVGTEAFSKLERTKAGLIDCLHIRIDVQEEIDPAGRVLIFNVPSRPLGVPIEYKGAYWMRGGEDLVPMTQDMLKRIFEETGHDFSSEICPNAAINDLVPEAIEKFRELWQRKSGNQKIKDLVHEELLRDTELILDVGLTYAALILFGSRKALGKFLPQAEVIFEYRARDISGPAQHRLEFREGWFLFEEELVNAINLRNDIQHFQDGLFVWDIRTFNETIIREAVLNAVCHRDYRLHGSIFVRQFPREMEIESPGGFIPGINPDNILWRQASRNRRIAETLQRCGFVERSGQGMNLMFEECIKESKDLPDFSKTGDYQVVLNLFGEVHDLQFLRFLEKIAQEKQIFFTTKDLLVLNKIHRGEKIPSDFQDWLCPLLERGVVEKAGRGKYILSRDFYNFIGKKGIYTRKRGLDRETNKALLLKHIQENKKEGSPLRDLLQVLPSLTRYQVQRLLRELKEKGKIEVVGSTRAGLWYPSGHIVSKSEVNR